VRKRVRDGLIWMAAVALLAGCAGTAPTIERTDDVSKPTHIEAVPAKPETEGKNNVAVVVQKPLAPEPPAPPPVTPPVLHEDQDLFFAGIALLDPPGSSDPAPARLVFAELVERYPQSRWRSAAETVLRLIDAGEAARSAGLRSELLREKGDAERSRALQENEQLKKTVRELTEKLQTATASLTQENEQLKKDLQQLKNLEIELEKRERMLR
jgi:hypothetical protein